MRVAVVTGASAGIGREFVYAIDKDCHPDEIWVIARRAERLEDALCVQKARVQRPHEAVRFPCMGR